MTASLRLATFLLLLACATPHAQADDLANARRTFKHGIRSKDWKQRRAAYRLMTACDSVKCAETLLAATVAEKNAAVTLEGIRVLGALKSEEAQTYLSTRVRRATGHMSTVLLMALARQKGPAGAGVLSEILRGKDPQRAALAALALGAKAQEYSLPDLLGALDHSDWHVVAAAARGISQMAQSSRPQGASSSTALPPWFPRAEVLRALARRLETAQGVERGDLIRALETITTKRYGWNTDAWRVVAEGKRPNSATLRRRKYPPQMFGIPIYGQRVCVVMDATVHIDSAHPFQDRSRLQEVCQVAGGRELAWFRINTVEEFNLAHVARGIRDMPTENKFEVFFSGMKVERVFGKLVIANTSNKERAVTTFRKIKHSAGNDALAAMHRALDVSGKSASAAWQKGPDTVLCVYSSDPANAKEVDQEVIGATIGLKAGSRLVRIEAVGVAPHAGAMLKLFAGLSGGTYLSLER